MNKIEETLEKIQAYPAIPVYYHADADTCLNVLKACHAGGIRVFEFTDRGENALHNFSLLLEYRDQYLPDLKLGIGTIKTTEKALEYILAGADFMVSPIFKASLAELASEHQLLWIPGCMTPTEIGMAEDAGAALVKLFPGDTLGPGFLKAVRPLFPQLQFMPTGGVGLGKESIESWLNAGVTALGFGSKLFEQAETPNGDYSWLSKRCSTVLEMLNRK